MTRRWKVESTWSGWDCTNPGPSTSALASDHHSGQSGSTYSEDSGREPPRRVSTHTVTGRVRDAGELVQHHFWVCL